MKREEYIELVERTLDEVLPKAEERPSALSEAMRYAVGTGGKRIRPLICLASAVAAGGQAEDARYPAAARWWQRIRTGLLRQAQPRQCS